MRRREVLLGPLALAWGAPTVAQSRKPFIAIVVLREPSPSEEISSARTAVTALAALGWIDGQTARVEVASAGGRLGALPALVRGIVQRKPDIIVAGGGTVTAEVVSATQDIPVVMATSAFDPVERGWADSYNRPGRSVTGLTLVSDEVIEKQLELLREADPSIQHIGLLRTQGNMANQGIVDRAEQIAPRLGLRLTVREMDGESGVEPAIQGLREAGADALLPVADPIMDTLRSWIAEVAIRLRLPTVAQLRFYTTDGFLMTYAADLNELNRRAAWYVDRILKGAKPAEMPIERPTKFILTLNVRTARAISLSIPPSLLVQADEVIE